MNTRSSTAFVVLLIIILGLAVGFWVAGLWSVPSPGSSTATNIDSAPPMLVPGWCCMQRGNTCTEEKSGAVTCLQNGGALFNRSQDICDSICKRLKQQ